MVDPRQKVSPPRVCTKLVFLSLHINFDDNQQAYHYLVNQDRFAWTWELGPGDDLLIFLYSSSRS